MIHQNTLRSDVQVHFKQLSSHKMFFILYFQLHLWRQNQRRTRSSPNQTQTSTTFILVIKLSFCLFFCLFSDSLLFVVHHCVVLEEGWSGKKNQHAKIIISEQLQKELLTTVSWGLQTISVKTLTVKHNLSSVPRGFPGDRSTVFQNLFSPSPALREDLWEERHFDPVHLH